MFWKGGAGFWARTSATIMTLVRHVQLCVIYSGAVNQHDLQVIKQKYPDIDFSWINDGKNKIIKVKLKHLREIINNQTTADIYLIDKTENTYALDALPQNVITLLDTHDLVHKRNKSAHLAGITDGFNLTSRQERDLFRHYDGIICIQEDDYNTVSQWAGDYKNLLVPHPIPINPQRLSATPTRVGIVASAWHANIHGLNYFIKHIWPKLENTNLSLNLYGYITEAFQTNTDPSIHLHGFKEKIDDCYKHIDIAVNPVFYGAGLKIKTIEAMAYGIPQVTTTEGASGLQHLSNKAFLMANNDEQFIDYINLLLNDEKKRKQISDYAVEYVKDNLSEAQCFKPLIDFIRNC